jgi:GTP-binding protein HflX
MRVSAVTGEGLPQLLEAITRRLPRKTQQGVMHLQPAQGRQRAKLFAMGAVLSEEACEDGGWNIELKIGERDLQRFLQQENLAGCFLEPLPMSVAAIDS